MLNHILTELHRPGNYHCRNEMSLVDIRGLCTSSRQVISSVVIYSDLTRTF